MNNFMCSTIPLRMSVLFATIFRLLWYLSIPNTRLIDLDVLTTFLFDFEKLGLRTTAMFLYITSQTRHSNLSLLPIILYFNESSSFFYDFYTTQFILIEKRIYLFSTFLFISVNTVHNMYRNCKFLFVIAWLCCCRPSVEWWAGAGASGPQRGTRWSCCSSGTGTAVVLQQANNMSTKNRVVSKTKNNTRKCSATVNKMSERKHDCLNQKQRTARGREVVLQQANNMRSKKSQNKEISKNHKE